MIDLRGYTSLLVWALIVVLAGGILRAWWQGRNG